MRKRVNEYRCKILIIRQFKKRYAYLVGTNIFSSHINRRGFFQLYNYTDEFLVCLWRNSTKTRWTISVDWWTIQPSSTLGYALNFNTMKTINNFEMYELIVKKYGKDFMKSYEYLSSTSVDRLKIKIVCNKLLN